jgi:hypothetical protein
MRSHFVLALVLLSAPAYSWDDQMWTLCDESVTAPGECIDELVDKWNARGPSEFEQYGLQLSKAVVVHPEAFLSTMAEDEFAYRTWRDTLREHTLRVSKSTDLLEGRLQAAYCQQLLAEMLTTLSRVADHPVYGAMARDLRNALTNAQVTHR